MTVSRVEGQRHSQKIRGGGVAIPEHFGKWMCNVYDFEEEPKFLPHPSEIAHIRVERGLIFRISCCFLRAEPFSSLFLARLPDVLFNFSTFLKQRTALFFLLFIITSPIFFEGRGEKARNQEGGVYRREGVYSFFIVGINCLIVFRFLEGR